MITMNSVNLLSWEPLGGGRELKSAVRSPLFNILTQINIAAENGLDLIAVSMAVALPDICAALASADGRTEYKRYVEWCRQHLKVGFERLTPEDLYSMRCGVLHNGRLGDLKKGIKQVVLIPGGGSTFSDCTAGDTYVYSVIAFCLNMNRAVVAWYEANEDDLNVRKHIQQLMQYRDYDHEFVGRQVIT